MKTDEEKLKEFQENNPVLVYVKNVGKDIKYIPTRKTKVIR